MSRGGASARVGTAALVATFLLPVIGLAAFSWSQTQYPSPIDYSLFGVAGGNLLSGHWAHVFVDPRVQAGPFELIPYGVAHLLHVSGHIGWLAFYICLIWLLIFVLLSVVFTALGPISTRWALYLGLAAGAIALLTGYIPSSTFLGHPAQVIIPLCWVLAACFARERRFVLCGIVVAISAGWELWGVLGAPVLLLAIRPNYLRAAIGAVAVVAVTYLPFAATGTFRMFGFGWPVSTNTLSHLLWPDMTVFPWSLRLLQAVVAIGVGCGAALLTRGTDYGPWLVPLVILATRLLLDPVLFGYYWLAPATIAIGLLAVCVHRRSWAAAVAAALLVAWFLFPQLEQLAGALALFVVGIVWSITVSVFRRRSTQGLPAPRDQMIDRMSAATAQK